MRLKLDIYIPLGLLLLVLNPAFGLVGSEEKFIKKYAMMKVYESCFGSQVLKEIRKEMRDAAQKCSDDGPPAPSDDRYSNKDGVTMKPTHHGDWFGQDAPFKAKPATGGVKVRKPIHTTDTLLLQQWSEEQKQGSTSSDGSTSEEQDQSEGDNTSGAEVEGPAASKKPVDISKLEEAILNIGRPVSTFTLQKPTSTATKFHQPTAHLGYYPPMYYPPPIPFPPSYPYHAYYPGYFQTPAAAHVGSSPFQSIYRHGVRSAKITNFNARRPRQTDLRTQFDTVGFPYNTKMRNISCIMQELGYLDANLEPNYGRMNERISKLNVDEELKRDMLDGVRFCKQFSQCIPETRHDSQLSKELLRPMFFFKCYKHKKLESCIMKDIRERVTQTSAELNNEVRRSFPNNDIIGPIFDSLFGYGSASDDFDSSIF